MASVPAHYERVPTENDSLDDYRLEALKKFYKEERKENARLRQEIVELRSEIQRLSIIAQY
jgi:hypothetical protein